MTAGNIIEILKAVPSDFEVNLNNAYEINEVNIFYPSREITIVVPEVQEEFEDGYCEEDEDGEEY
jgi:hypothetical protein